MAKDQRENSLSITVLEAVTEREDTGITDLPPLHNAIDPCALDQLFVPRYDGTPRRGGHVRFPYGDYMVTVHSDGRVDLSDQKR